jgi:phosphatidylserine decarboxylase
VKFNWADPPSRTAFPIAAPGYPFIFASAFITFVLALLGLTLPAMVALAATLGICAFFRDPDRVIPDEAGAAVSPADGKVIVTDAKAKSPFGEEDCVKISVFMSVFNVHVNRAPCRGRVAQIDYRPGRFYMAHKDAAVSGNEQNALLLEEEGGHKLVVVQIAGWVARRIICAVAVGDALARGQRFGMICFGSRLDLYLPPGSQLAVKKGDKVAAGTTILGYLS